MSQNELIGLNSNYNNWLKERATDLAADINPFNYYCIEQFLKPFDITDEDIIHGYTDGSRDGGVDAIYFIVDKKLVRDDTVFDTGNEMRVNLVIFQLKDSESGYNPNEIGKQYFYTDNFLKLSQNASDFAHEYHQQHIELMNTFREKYQIISGNVPSFHIDYYYITRGDEIKPDPNAESAANRVKEAVRKHFSKATCEYTFVNAQKILEQIQRRPLKKRVLSWSDTPMNTKEESYVGLVNLHKFYEFIKDEQGGLEHLIFEDNVRGYQQSSGVNLQIQDTLGKDKITNFWLLNNGITIITPKVGNAGYNQLSLTDPQIVNGLQTSREIFKYFKLLEKEKQPINEERSLLVKVIQASDGALQDKIIRATNNQNELPKGSLRATDKIHHRIEDYFKDQDFYYERRKKFYKDQRVPISKIVSMTELAQAVVSVLLQRPDEARRRPSDYLTDEEKYKSVFEDDKYPLPIYLICLKILRKVSAFIASKKELERNEKAEIKFYLTSFVASVLTREMKPTVEKLLQARVDDIDEEFLTDCFKRVKTVYDNIRKTEKGFKGSVMVSRLKTNLSRKLKTLSEQGI